MVRSKLLQSAVSPVCMLALLVSRKLRLYDRTEARREQASPLSEHCVHLMKLKSISWHVTAGQEIRILKRFAYVLSRVFYTLVSINTLTARPGCWSEWITDSYCSLKPLWSGMGEVVPARTSPTLHPPSPPTVL